MYPTDYLNSEDEEQVKFFSSPYDVLNNWGANAVRIWGINFMTAEHAFQYKKFETSNPRIAERIKSAQSPWAVYQITRENREFARTDWQDIKLKIMEEIINAKLQQNDDVREQLIKTGRRTIVENSPWDSFWGAGSDGKGENHLGKIWMNIREKLNEQ